VTLLRVGREVLIWVLIALFLAVSFDPAVRALSRLHIRRGIAIAGRW
jgi:predicted PurR-regulated permease PerM